MGKINDKEFTLFDFFKKALLINLTGFGGAPLTVGFYKKEFVDTNLITLSELNQYVAVGNVLPGAMSFFACGLIGHNLFNKKGLIVGVFTCLFPIMLITMLVFSLLASTSIHLEQIVLAVLPIILYNTLKYVTALIKYNLHPVLKYLIFIISLVLIFNYLNSTQLVLLFFFIVIVINFFIKDEYEFIS